MARRAVSALPAMLAVMALALPAELLISQAGAAAATSAPLSPSVVAVSITSMAPQWARPGTTITVSGTLRNTSGQQDGHLTVQLLGSVSPVASVTQLAQNATTATMTLPGATWRTAGQLAPGATVKWSIRLRASAVGMTSFGVYPLAAQVQSALGTVLDTTTTYLPYMPAKKGTYASTRPSPAKIAWIWPLIDKPLLNEPWQDNCKGRQARALAQSLSSGGRLSDLVQAGTLMQTTESWTAAAGASSHATSAEPPQNLADYDGITWAVDPALLVNARALTTCHGANPRWANAASAWLTELQTVTTGRPLTVTPYGDPNVTALINVGHGADVQRSFQLGRTLAGRIMHRSISPGATGDTPAALTQTAGIAWPAGGVPGYGTLENLAVVDSVRAVVVSSSALLAAPSSVLQTVNGGGGYIDLLLASDSLTQLLGSAGSTPGAAFDTAQKFLAETALLAGQGSSQPLVVAPPRRWDPPAGLAAELLAATARAPWLSPVSLESLTSARHIQNWPAADLPIGSTGRGSASRAVLRELRALNREIAALQSIRARPDADLYLPVSAVESSAWQSISRATPRGMLLTLARDIALEQKAVQIVSEPRITLGGLKGPVPVSIENRLGYAVRVKLELHFSQATGMKITPDPGGLITVPAHMTQTVRLRVQATGVGSTTITMRLANQYNQPLAAAAARRMTIQATQVGVLGMIIFAAALGVFLIASAARAVRRGRPPTGTDQRGSDEAADDHGDDRGADHAEPDTVMAERSQLGAAPGTPGP
jgi:Family of unknown function (DUF6049)